MCYFIVIEDLIANALIEEMERGSSNDKKFFSYRELEELGARVVKILMDKNKKAVLVLSREKTEHMLSDYNDCFEEREENGVKGIGLKSGVDYEALIDTLRGCLPLEVVLAFIEAENCVK